MDGLFCSGSITLWQNLHVLVGVRYDWADNVARASFAQFPPYPTGLPNQTIHQTKFSPRVGLVYDVAPWLTFYANYLQSLSNNPIARDFNGVPFTSGVAESYEGGAKMTLFDNKVLATLAFFHLTKTNVINTRSLAFGILGGDRCCTQRGNRIRHRGSGDRSTEHDRELCVSRGDRNPRYSLRRQSPAQRPVEFWKLLGKVPAHAAIRCRRRRVCRRGAAWRPRQQLYPAGLCALRCASYTFDLSDTRPSLR
jgi:hypothetical protein